MYALTPIQPFKPQQRSRVLDRYKGGKCLASAIHEEEKMSQGREELDTHTRTRTVKLNTNTHEMKDLTCSSM